MVSLNNILKSSGKTEIRTRLLYYNQSPKKHEKKYTITWTQTEGRDPCQGHQAGGYFVGSIDNILEYCEKELELDEDGIWELKELIEINRL